MNLKGEALGGAILMTSIQERQIESTEYLSLRTVRGISIRMDQTNDGLEVAC
jgi:hypothetical protein